MKTKATTYMAIGVILGILFGSIVGVIARADSFGNAQEIEPMDHTGFFNALRDHTEWSLEYKRYLNSSWTDGSDYMTIEKTQIDDQGMWKFNLILDVPVRIESCRFTFGVDLPVLSYVEKVGEYQYLLNYSNYSCFFDWSDMASIPNIVFTHGIHEEMFWFRFSRSGGINSGIYEFDPWFGNQDSADNSWSVKNIIVNSPYLLNYDCDYAIANNITVYLSQWTTPKNVTCGLYINSTKVLVAQTEIILLSAYGAPRWQTFNFTSNISLIDNTIYLISVWSEDDDGACAVQYNESGGVYYTNNSVFDGTLNDPFVIGTNTNGKHILIYCNYTCYNDTVDTNLTDEGCYCFSLAPSLLGFILIFLFFFFAEKKEDVLLYFLTSFIAVVMGVYYLILLDGVSFTSWIGVILILFGVYTSFMGLAYSLKHKRK